MKFRYNVKKLIRNPFFILIITVIDRKNTKKDIKSKESIVNRKK